MGVLDAKVESVFETIDQAKRLKSVEELERLMGAAFRSFGFDTYLSAQTREIGGTPTARVHFGHVNQTYARAYTELKLYENDAVVRRAVSNDDFFSWSDLLAEGDVLDAERPLFDLARDCGGVDAFITPAHSLDGSATAVQLTTRHRLSLSPHDHIAVHMLSLYFSSIGQRLAGETRQLVMPKAIKLSPRQRECLQWRRAGKTIWEISVILSISQDTVKEHIDAARKKLGVNTPRQAVIEAVARGLIHL